MSFQYTGIYWLKNDSKFCFPDMSEYIRNAREGMKRPLKAPEFAAAGDAITLANLKKELPHIRQGLVRVMLIGQKRRRFSRTPMR